MQMIGKACRNMVAKTPANLSLGTPTSRREENIKMEFGKLVVRIRDEWNWLRIIRYGRLQYSSTLHRQWASNTSAIGTHFVMLPLYNLDCNDCD
jgi:hypothetical protein